MSYWTDEERARIVAAASERIGADLLRTVGHSLQIRLSDNDDFGELLIYFDGALDAGVGWPMGATIEESVADIADRLQECTLHEEVWGGWPICGRPHHTHPLVPVVRAAHAVWLCPADDETIAPIGELRRSE
jgi:hypothetical protein